jgi:hypothetical protein
MRTSQTPLLASPSAPLVLRHDLPFAARADLGNYALSPIPVRDRAVKWSFVKDQFKEGIDRLATRKFQNPERRGSREVV